jgi:hypothetical protein
MALGDFSATYVIINDQTIAASGAKLVDIIEALRTARPQAVRARPSALP